MVKLFPALTAGRGFTTMVTVSVLEHPMADVTVTIYVVVNVGEATGFEMFGLLSPVDGLQE